MSYTLDTVINRKNTHSLKYDCAAERGKPEDILPFWVADMDFKTAQPVLDALEKSVRHGIFGYTESGIPYVRALRSWYMSYFGWEIKPEWLVKTPGVVFAICTAIRALTHPGDAVLIQPPVYYPFSESIRANHRKLVTSPLILKNEHYEMDWEDLEKRFPRMTSKCVFSAVPITRWDGYGPKKSWTDSAASAENTVSVSLPTKSTETSPIPGTVKPYLPLCATAKKILLLPAQPPAKLLTWPDCRTPISGFPMKPCAAPFRKKWSVPATPSSTRWLL